MMFPVTRADLEDGSDARRNPRWWLMPDGLTVWGVLHQVEERRWHRAVVYRLIIHNWDGNMATWAQLNHVRGWRPGDGSEIESPCEYIGGRRCLR